MLKLQAGFGRSCSNISGGDCAGVQVSRTGLRLPELACFVCSVKQRRFFTMFDLKKRSSLTLRDCRETEEFRRVAVRRKSSAAVAAGEDRTPGKKCERSKKIKTPKMFPNRKKKKIQPFIYFECILLNSFGYLP